MNYRVTVKDGHSTVEVLTDSSATVIVGREERERVFLPPTGEVESSYYQGGADTLESTEDGYRAECDFEAEFIRVVG